MPPAARALWRQMTTQAHGRFIAVECTCSDPAEHRARFERRQQEQHNLRRARTRRRGFDWAYVEATMKRYQPDQNPDYVADSIQPVATLLTAIWPVITEAEQA